MEGQSSIHHIIDLFYYYSFCHHFSKNFATVKSYSCTYIWARRGWTKEDWRCMRRVWMQMLGIPRRKFLDQISLHEWIIWCEWMKQKRIGASGTPWSLPTLSVYVSIQTQVIVGHTYYTYLQAYNVDLLPSLDQLIQ